ncbi:DUF6193 family natural product biosynthesis protein [Streptomyces sp. SP18CS02]|uniref:DUF6193 family natural product biosynthesis protein n=1 Tax=Streptomyces sp. SP18CS02 TaxID=3002531 RepID=UPI002E77A772|nr:DUF6193 family natural product biosynthesis protein [Streptomyces sp. SP18CS02]MEE1756381.1 DUF6193 family natural product biosynthesis protein [Streptomyces sp. SP18CS02]
MTKPESPRSAAEIVAAEWQDILDMGQDLIDPVVPRTMYANPRLRELYPVVSHGTLLLSRCIHFPWTHDVGTLHKQAGGGYRVRRGSDRTVLGVAETVREAVDLIAANLPAGCGPAIDGTADDLPS